MEIILIHLNSSIKFVCLVVVVNITTTEILTVEKFIFMWVIVGHYLELLRQVTLGKNRLQYLPLHVLPFMIYNSMNGVEQTLP